MTEEGELKKRINYVFMKPRYTPNEMVPELKELWQDIHNVADEAKKDFPFLEPFTEGEPLILNPSMSADKLMKILDWFVKWFGGCEESSGEETQK